MKASWPLRSGLLVNLIAVALTCSTARGVTTAPASAPAEQVNCAVITDPALREHPIAAFLEATLSSDPRFCLLERDRLDALLREQQIQIMFSANSVPQRMALGALLKVDLMIMLRLQKTREREELQAVICETGSGYRLRVRQFAWPPGEDTQDQVLELVDQAVEKWHTPSRAAFAVPRFLCKDFVPDITDYRDDFTRDLERSLIGYPSIVLVELPEATAISTELGLHNTGQALERQLPYYLRGEYETKQKDGSTSLTIKVALCRGTQTLKTYRAENVSLPEAKTYIRGIPREVLRDTLLTTNRNPELEAIDLVRQAETFYRSGDNETARSLMSTAVLLRPDNLELLRKAGPYGALSKEHREHLARLEEARMVAEGKGWLIGLEQAKRDAVAKMKYIQRFQDSPEAEIAILELLVPCCEYSWTKDHRLGELRPSRKLLTAVRDPDIRRTIDEVAALPGPIARGVAKRLQAFAESGEEAVRKEEEKRKQWIGRDLNPSSFVHCRQGNKVTSIYVYTRGEVPRDWTPPRRQKEEAEFSLEPLNLRVVGRVDHGRPRFATPEAEVPAIAGWLPCGPGVDVMWSASEIYVMREPGVLRSVYGEDEACFQQYSEALRRSGGDGALITSPFRFDGRYVWAPAFAAQQPHLVLLDLQTGEARRIGPEQGLPPMDQGLCVAAVRPGEACVAAGFRKDRKTESPPDATWCAIVRLDSGQVKTEFLLKANEQPLPGEFGSNWAERAGSAFWPLGLHLLTDPDNSRATLIVLRQNWMAFPRNGLQPLAIDLQSHETRLVAGVIPGVRPDTVFAKGSTLYTPCQDQLWVLGVPRLEVEHKKLTVSSIGFGALNICSIAMLDGLFHCVSQDGWWVSSAPGEEGRRLKGNVSGELRRFGPLIASQHHGLILLAGRTNESIRPYQVKFSAGLLAGLVEKTKRDWAERAENRRNMQGVMQEAQAQGMRVKEEPAQTPLEVLQTWAPVGAIGLAIPAVLIWFLVRGRTRRRQPVESVSSKEVSK